MFALISMTRVFPHFDIIPKHIFRRVVISIIYCIWIPQILSKPLIVCSFENGRINPDASLLTRRMIAMCKLFVI